MNNYRDKNREYKPYREMNNYRDKGREYKPYRENRYKS